MILLVGGLLRFVLLSQYADDNPLATHLVLDARAYWQWAGRIAAGEFQSDEPFFSAPLYPYLLGIVRACGGTLTTVYAFQVLLDLLTAGLLAWIAGRRFNAAVGLLAAGIFLLMLEPASFCVRVLASSLQLPLVCVTWLGLLWVQEQPRSWGRVALAGVATGLLALTFPPVLLLVPLCGLWVWWLGGWRLAAAVRGVVLMLAAVVAISPATIHNYRACGEFIPISAQAGLTFAHGNQPRSDGTYTPVPGVSPDRETQNRDALRFVEQSTGKPATWRGTNSFFFRRGLEYWRDNPGPAIGLLLAKAYWFIAGRNYGDVYAPVAEIDVGLFPWLRLAPLRTAWLILPALVTLVLLRRPRRYLPEIALFALPLLVVVLFFYSPRYRLPAVPVIIVLCAYGLSQAARLRSHRIWSVTIFAALVVGFGLGFVNRAAGFDPLKRPLAHLYGHLGWAASQDADLETAVRWYQKAVDLGPDLAPALARLGTGLFKLGQHEEAIRHLSRAVRVDPSDAFAQHQLGRSLTELRQFDAALSHLRAAAELRPGSAEIRNDLGIALARTGDRSGARQQYETALRLDPTYAETHLNLGLLLIEQGQLEAAEDRFRTALELDPSLALAHYHLGNLHLTRGAVAAGLAELRQAHALDPEEIGICGTLAWYLATLPERPAAERRQALELAQQANAATGGRSPHLLNTLAAALAANGRFDEAVAAVRQAIATAEAMGADELVEKMRVRLELYSSGQPSIIPVEPGRP